MVEEAGSEANVSAQQPAPGQAPRVPAPNVHPRWPSDPQEPTAEGAPSSVGLIWRARGRAPFVALRQSRLDVREGPLRVRFALGPDGEVDRPPQVAFAVGRRVGKAVVRNRLRRRLREAVRHVARTVPDLLPSGVYLIVADRPATSLSQAELITYLERALRRLHHKAVKR